MNDRNSALVCSKAFLLKEIDQNLNETKMSELLQISPKNSDADTNVILIHGLFGDKDDTWTYQANSSNFFWPEGLEHDLPNSKVWTFGYSSSIVKDGSKPPFVPKISHDLYNCIREEEQFSGKNIVFIAHSLGGVLVKQLIRKLFVHSQMDGNSDEILQSIKGVVFIATPHQGSNLAEFFNYDASIINQLHKNAVSQLVPGNAYLTDLYEDYITIVRNYCDIEHIQYRENKNTELFDFQNMLGEEKAGNFTIASKISVLKDVVVNSDFSPRKIRDFFSQRIVDSSSSYSGIGEPPYPIDEDHIAICKIKNKKEKMYIEILNHIKNI